MQLAQRHQAGALRARARPATAAPCRPARRVACRAEQQQQDQSQQQQQGAVATEEPQQQPSTVSLDQQLSKLTKQTAGTFAPRASGPAKKNPAVRGSTLYWVFEVQAWLALAVGGLLSFNLIFPTDEPSIPRLMGMWSIWMFTIPSLRAKECTAREKDALNLLFLLVPLVNVALPFVAKSFPLIFAADVAAVAGVYAWKGVWAEVYGLPIGAAAEAAPAGGEGAPEQGQQ